MKVFYCYIVLLLSKYCYHENALAIVLFWETNHTPSNLWSQGFGLSAFPVCMIIVMYPAVGFKGVAYSKAALQYKTSAAKSSGILFIFVMGQLTILTPYIIH